MQVKMTENVGIASIETVAGFFCGIGVDIEASLADGKFTVTDLARFLDDAMKIPGLIKALPNLDDEFLDLIPEENKEIVAFIKEKLNLPDADVTEVIEAIVSVVLSTSTVIKEVKTLVAAIKDLKHPEV